MLIYCPKCLTGYEINDELIKNRSRKLKCSRCNEVFEVENQLEKSVDNIAFADDVDNNDMKDISEEDAFASLAALMRDADLSNKDDFVTDTIDNITDDDRELATENVVENESIPENADVAAGVVENESIPENADVAAGVVENESIPENADVAEENVIDADNIDLSDSNTEEQTNSDNIIKDDNAELANESESDGNDETEAINIETIYERLSEHTSNLIEREKTLPIYEKIWLKIKDVLGFHFRIKWSYVFVGIFVFVSLFLFNNRYEVVRKIPFMNGVYKALGIKAKIAGEGLEFQNINWDYVIDEGTKKLEIKGFINNVTSDAIDIPVIHVEILDKNTALLQSFNRKIKEKEISSNNRVPLQIIVESPAPTAKYVYLTFIDEK